MVVFSGGGGDEAEEIRLTAAVVAVELARDARRISGRHSSSDK